MITAKLLLAYLLHSVNIAGMPADTSNIDQQEAYCLAENVFYEARDEDIKGQFAVASVTLNRTKDIRYPNTVCGVVHQTAKSKRTHKIVCAFSWYCTKEKDIPVGNKDGSINQSVVDQFQVASLVAISVLSGKIVDNTRGATHFFNPAVSNPDWSHEFIHTIKLGHHEFYKQPPIVVSYNETLR